MFGTNIFEYIQISDDTPIERVRNKDVFIKHTPTNNFIMNVIKLSLDDDKKALRNLNQRCYKRKRNRNSKRGFCRNINPRFESSDSCRIEYNKLSP